MGDFHRYLLPKYQNEFTDQDLSVWCVNPDEAYQLVSVCEIENGLLKYATFKSLKAISGRLEIRNSDNETLFYSNCIEFLDSTDSDGRKFIRIATKHTYNRNLFDYQGNHNWIITSVPAYCLGMTSVDADVSNSRTGGISTLKIRETYLDEITEYEFISRGDANVLNFLQVHATNNEFFIDGTKRTCTDKIDRDEFSIAGRLKFTNVKDKYGFNIFMDYDDILDDMYDTIYADDVTYNYTYSHKPVNDPSSGEWFLANLLFNNYHNPFGILYNCDLKIKLISVPVKGFLAHNTTKQIYAPNDVISYCEKDNLVYYPNGFNNDLGVSGNFSETFSYKIIDQDGRIGRLTTHTLVMTDSATEPIDISVSILWNDDTSAPKTGTLGNIIVKLASLTFDPADPIITQQWEVWNGTEWIFYADKTADNQTISLPYMSNRIRLKVVSQFSVVAYSNVLAYTKTASANIYITDSVFDVDAGTASYKLHVEGFDFVGFINKKAEKNFNAKNAYMDSTHGDRLIIPHNNDYGEFAENSTAVTIPIGVYDCGIIMKGSPKLSIQDVDVSGSLEYGYTQIFGEGIIAIDANLTIYSV